MTVFLNVTDAIGAASNHGITRVERKLAVAMAPFSEVQFVVMQAGQLWVAPKDLVTPRLDLHSSNSRPLVERFGVDPSTPQGARSGKLRALRDHAARRRAASLGSVPLKRLECHRSDALVSMGVDWTRGVVDEAERLVYGVGVSYLGFCYDLIPIDHPEWVFPPDTSSFRRHFSRMVRVASTIVCISERTRRDLVRHFSDVDAERLRVLVLGSDAALDVTAHDATFAQSMFDGEPYAIYCATLDRRKNHHVLYRAMREMGRRRIDGNLVFVGMGGSGVDDLMSAMRNDPLTRGRIAHVTNCDDHHLAALYRRSSFAVYPSLYEGWGLGVTEALAHGKRSIVATGSSLEEASFGTAHTIHPLDTGQWVDSIAQFFEHEQVLPSVPLPTWEDAARELLQTANP